MPEHQPPPARVNIWQEFIYRDADGNVILDHYPQWNAHIHGHPHWTDQSDNTDPLWEQGPFRSLEATLDAIRVMWPTLPISNLNFC